MASVTGYTAAHMDAMMDDNIVDARIDIDHLILIKRDLSEVDAGVVGGTAGPAGPSSIIVCTSTTRPSGGALFEGLAIYETDTDSVYIYDGSSWIPWLITGAWTSYTPALVQSSAVGKTVNYAKYVKRGRVVSVNVLLTCTGAGVAANNIVVSLPVTPDASYAAGVPMGSFIVRDASTGFSYPGIAVCSASGTDVVGIGYAQQNFLGQAGMTNALASGDTVGFSLTYESAS